MTEIWDARLLVRGGTVTPEQGGEILLRTNSWWAFSFQDREWGTSLAYSVGLELVPHGHEPTPETLQRLQTRFGVLPLTCLYTARIGCRFMGGPRGWCDWTGRIEAGTYDLPPYRDPAAVTADWRMIASAFPYLRLDAQTVRRGTPTGQWRIEAGTVRALEPGTLLAPIPEDPDPLGRPPGPERSFPIARLDAAIERLDQALHGRSLADEYAPDVRGWVIA